MTLKRHPQHFEVTECSNGDIVIDRMVSDKRNTLIKLRSHFLIDNLPSIDTDIPGNSLSRISIRQISVVSSLNVSSDNTNGRRKGCRNRS